MKKTFLGFPVSPVRAILLIVVVILVDVAGFFVFTRWMPDRAVIPVIVNRSGHELTIIQGDEITHVPDGEMAESKHWWPGIRLEIEQGEIWDYEPAPFKYQGYVFNYHFYCQVESDGSIYLLPFKADGPVERLPSQPEGYPLRPRTRH
jgi:hypothetical protein